MGSPYRVANVQVGEMLGWLDDLPHSRGAMTSRTKRRTRSRSSVSSHCATYMRPFRKVVRVALMLIVCACGARSEIAGSGGDLFDSSLPVSDGSFGFDVTNGSDVGTIVDAGVPCTEASIQVGCGGSQKDCTSCKYQVTWSCGDDEFRIGGSCDPPDVGFQGGYYQGVCDENGKQTSTFMEPTTTCDCKDASALITIVQEKCQHQ